MFTVLIRAQHPAGTVTRPPTGKSPHHGDGRDCRRVHLRRFADAPPAWLLRDLDQLALVGISMQVTFPCFVRCKDNTLARDVLDVGRVYEVGGEEYGNYRVLDRWFTKARFEPATLDEWLQQKAW